MNRREYIKNTALFLGYAVSASAVSDLLISCQNEAKLTWQPVFLSNNQANTIAEMAETILPRTATPGAKDLGVPQFIDKMLKELLTEADQKEFVEGIESLDKRCEKDYGKAFVACEQKQKEEILTQLDKEAAKFPPSLWGIVLVEKPDPITFFRRMKSLTLMGYFTSEKVGKEILRYDPVPGTYIGCMPLNGMNSWTE
ncbi:gluconate 2-dehydrogenase subunit 3 family protein [Emticicia sp. SJ17W-69]|uniref:gluconate 2-dehydrogenase subunit 3 family protein n=1 Tax=Emticicia sp. SJ17W-69 TaxID=3421657 RepID=UPI003EBBC5BA